MSKFTKALEKIQESRQESAPEPKKSVSSLKLPPMDDMQERMSFLDRVTTVKNTLPDNRLVMLRFPDSMVAEQYRMLRTSLKAQLAQQQAKVILICSSIHSEGKTVTASNLATSLAENGDHKVALVDGDLRRGKVADYFGFGKERPGLTEFLSTEEMSPRQVMLRSALKNLFVIPRGTVAKKPSDLVSSHKFSVLIAELRAHFDYVIIDAPPIMSVADAGILARETDGVLFIVQIGRTPKSVIAHSHVLLKQADAKMLGYVVTNVEFQSADYRYYSNYYYGDEPDRAENRGKNSIREKTRTHLKKAGWGLKNVEERFNDWWDRSVLKKEGSGRPYKAPALKEVGNQD
jgi:capsular exopolysaccharide synthesis family protein